jgi:hypothetical protein
LEATNSDTLSMVSCFRERRGKWSTGGPVIQSSEVRNKKGLTAFLTFRGEKYSENKQTNNAISDLVSFVISESLMQGTKKKIHPSPAPALLYCDKFISKNLAF